MHPFTLPEQALPILGLTPATDAAGRASAYVSLRNAHKAWAIFLITQGNAATVECSVNQAKDTSGTSAKAIGTTRIWADLDTATLDALVRQTDAANFTTDAALKDKLVVIEIDPEELDIANGFSCVAMVTGASNVANITAGLLWLMPLRVQSDPPPSALS